MEYNTWSDLPADLLRLVYAKVVGLPQRVRFAAVCTSWRDAATGTCHEAPPALPWHISSSSDDRIVRMFCPEDCEELHARLPGAALLKRFVGAHDGGWIAALTRIRKHLTLVVVNLLSGVEVPLSMKQGKFVPSGDREGRPGDIQKIVFSKAPTSDGCILVALTYSSAIALCRVDCPEEEGWIMTQEQSRLADIAFCNGELYGLTTMKELVWFDITDKDGATPLSVVVTRLLSVQERAPSVYRNHLFDMGGKLAMARTWWSWGCNDKAMLSFEVLELAYDGQENTPKWVDVTTLGEHALFLGKTCSKAVRVPTGGRGRVEKNCIFSDNAFSRPLYRGHENERCTEDVRSMKLQVGYYSPHQSQAGMWLIPPSV